MKITAYRLRTLLGFAAFSGFAILPLAAIAEEPAPAQPTAAGDEKPDFSKIRGMVREMMELKRAGKHEEAERVAERIKTATNNNPRVVEMLERQKKAPGHEARGKEARRSEDHPKAKDNELKGEAMEPKNRHEKPMHGKIEAKEEKPRHPENAGPKDPERNAINPVERIRHLRVAAEHLEAAGVEGMAKAVRSQIEGMEKRMKQAESSGENREGRIHSEGGGDFKRPMQFGMRPGAPPMGPGSRFGGYGQQWRGFQAPGANAKPPGAPGDPNAALLGEIRKLREEMGELRGEVKRMQARDAAMPKRPHPPASREGRPE